MQPTDAFFFLEDVTLLLEYISVGFQDHGRFLSRGLSDDNLGLHLMIPVVIIFLDLLLMWLVRGEFLQYGSKAHVILPVQALLET